MEQGNGTFETTRKAISSALVNTTRVASRIAAEDVLFYRSSSASVAQALDERSLRLLALAQGLMRRASRPSDSPGHHITTVADIESSWKSVVDKVDTLLERADLALDEFSGLVRNQAGEDHTETANQTTLRTRQRGFRNLDIPKPQLHFDHPSYNHESAPFQPILLEKPHGCTALVDSLVIQDGQYLHPYQTEIEQYEYPASVYKTSEPIRPAPLEATTATFVDNPHDLDQMLKELRTAREVAVDLEHHDMHSYIGIVSLMQISTRQKDWIVDTLKPWRRRLQCLNDVFADPRILKVFHGSTSDMVWLQRDLGIYVVGLFDTYHASCVLGYPGHSLAYLLKRFVDFDAQKQYQMADWRVRPLPQELFEYARSDTHFLLYIYDCMRNELVQESNAKCDRIEPVLNRSRLEALQRYEHPFYVDAAQKSTNGWYNLLWKSPTNLSNESLAVFRRIHCWRDKVARDEDESPNHILPNHALFSIARILPRDKPALLSASHPLSSILRARLDELLHEIADGLEHDEEGAQIRASLIKPPRESPPGTGPPLDHLFTSTSGSKLSARPVNVQVRSRESHFWGNALQPSDKATVPSPARLPLHIVPGLRVFSTSTGQEANILSGQELSTEKNDLEESVSTITGISNLPSGRRKRKHDDRDRSAPEASEKESREQHGTKTGPSDSLSQFQDAVDRVRAKAARKLRKKAEHKTEDREPEPTVDYATAPSIDSARAGRGKEKGSKSAPFNPFAKAADATEGLGRISQPQSGRTATFKR